MTMLEARTDRSEFDPIRTGKHESHHTPAFAPYLSITCRDGVLQHVAWIHAGDRGQPYARARAAAALHQVVVALLVLDPLRFR